MGWDTLGGTRCSKLDEIFQIEWNVLNETRYIVTGWKKLRWKKHSNRIKSTIRVGRDPFEMLSVG